MRAAPGPDLTPRAVALVVLVATALASGCGAGPYGHARTYAPLDAEDQALAGATEYDPPNARRAPDQSAGKKVSLFGVVVRREEREHRAYLTLSLRTLEPRNLCENRGEDSCRVTVTEKEFDRVHARVTIPGGEDDASIGPGSLVRLVGTIDAAPDADDGAQVVTATYYRHWPRGYYVTTRAAQFLRR